MPALILAALLVAGSGLGCASLEANRAPSLAGTGTLSAGPAGSTSGAVAAAAAQRLEVQSTLAGTSGRESAPKPGTVLAPSTASSATGAQSAPSATAAQGTGPGLSALSTPDGLPSAQTPDERRDVLDAQLDRELAELDALLRREIELIATQRAERGTLGAGSAGGSAGEGWGGEPGAGEAGGPLEGERGEGEAGEPQEGEPAGAEPGGREAGGGAVGGGGGGEGATPKPAEGQARNPRSKCPDDIVAKQIREAAAKEKDPELKKKLWKEYEDYKNATCAKRKPAGEPPPPPSDDTGKEA